MNRLNRHKPYTLVPTAGGPTDQGTTLDELSCACAERFLHPWFVVRRDDNAETVWVSVTGGAVSIGLQPSTVERRGVSTVFSDTVARLADTWPEII